MAAKPTKRPGSKMASMSAKIKSMGPKLMAGPKMKGRMSSSMVKSKRR